MLQEHWSGMVWPASKEAIRNPDTGLERQTLETVGKASVAVPEGFVCPLVKGCLLQGADHGCCVMQEIHPRLQRHVNNRVQKIDSGMGLDWATAEVCPCSLPILRLVTLTPRDSRLWRLVLSCSRGVMCGFQDKMLDEERSVIGMYARANKCYKNELIFGFLLPPFGKQDTQC